MADTADLERRAAGGDIAAQLQLADECDARGEPEAASRWLGAAAKLGSLTAMAQLGARLVVGAGVPASLSDGKALLEFAASAGSGSALRHLATLALSGHDGEPEAEKGIALVQAAAEAGDAQSQAEMALLNEPQPLVPPAATELSAEPCVMRLETVASPELCRWLREWCEPALSPAGTIDKATGEFKREAARTNRFARIAMFDQPLELLLLKLRLAELVGQPVAHFEGTNILAYEPGERFAVHHDYLDPAAPGFAAELEASGQRAATVLVALNDDFTGGETAFPELGLSWRGKAGEALYFRNVGRDGQPDRRTLHEGRPPESGRKWLLSQWVRTRPQPPG